MQCLHYTDGKEHVFPRSPGAIGRKVQNCHSPRSVATVNRILDLVRAGTKDVAEFSIQMGGPLHPHPLLRPCAMTPPSTVLPGGAAKT